MTKQNKFVPNGNLNFIQLKLFDFSEEKSKSLSCMKFKLPLGTNFFCLGHKTLFVLTYLSNLLFLNQYFLN